MNGTRPGGSMHEVGMASRSEVGARSRNEDYVQFGAIDSGWYAVLADGAGGHSNGAIASDLVVRIATHELRSRAASATVVPQALGEVALAANDALNRQQSGAHGHQRMHATLVILWIDGALQQALWSHVGDSRLYVLRQGRVDRVTRDDSVVQTMVDAGLIAPEQAREHPNRNQLIAALGSEEPLEPHVSDALPLRDGDAFLLCSDGWYDLLSEADIEATLARAASAEEWLSAMERQVHERQRPNQDNYSAIAVWIGDPAESTRVGIP